MVEPGEAGHLHLLLPPPAVSPVRRDHQRVQPGARGEALPGPDETALPGRRRPPFLCAADAFVVGGRGGSVARARALAHVQSSARAHVKLTPLVSNLVSNTPRSDTNPRPNAAIENTLKIYLRSYLSV